MDSGKFCSDPDCALPDRLVPELCREHGMSSARFYQWRAKYGSMDASMVSRSKELEDENRRLKKMYAEERLKSEFHKEALEKMYGPLLICNKQVFEIQFA